MTVEDQRVGLACDDGAPDRFPVGMRILAVDDDPICLKVLENLLRKCQYQVTAMNQAVKALEMLRENKNMFDLVISDVNMPDINGFKLLELVGLEMDLPVIMLSAHSDTKLVMKGITHGAVDYLLKPVRIEELKNIWQHVVRKKKLDPKDQTKSFSEDNAGHGTEDGGKGVASTSNLDQNAQHNRKRKDQDEDEEDNIEDDEHENEDPSTQKRPRVVWSPELHRKFVAAVNQLGLEKAFPKKILDLMNVEGLTRENVASHLQKYRLYLKRISTAESQQVNMVAALGGKDLSYMRMATLDGFGDLRALTSSGRLSTSLPSYVHGGMLSRLNSPACLTLQGITSNGLIQPANPQNMTNSFNNALGKFQPPVLPNQSAHSFQGTPLNGEFNAMNVPPGFEASASFPDARVTVGSSSTMSNASANPLMLQGNPLQTHSRVALGNQSFDQGISGSSNFLDNNRCNESWQGAAQSSQFPSTAIPMNQPLNIGQLQSNNLGFSSTSSQIGYNPHDFSSSSVLPAPLADSRDIQGQVGLIGNNFQASNHYNQRSHQIRATNSLGSANTIAGSSNQSLYQNNAVCSNGFSTPIMDQFNGSTPSFFQPNEMEKSVIDSKMRSNDDYLFRQERVQDGFIQNSFESLDDITSSMMKRDHNETLLMDGEYGFGNYPLGSYS
ncbi:hypothetical protein UlMin_002643 [Ulmus minor]